MFLQPECSFCSPARQVLSFPWTHFWHGLLHKALLLQQHDGPFCFPPTSYGLYLYLMLLVMFVDGNSHSSQRTSMWMAPCQENQHVDGTVLSTLWVLSPRDPFVNPGCRCSNLLYPEEEMGAQKQFSIRVPRSHSWSVAKLKFEWRLLFA